MLRLLPQCCLEQRARNSLQEQFFQDSLGLLCTCFRLTFSIGVRELTRQFALEDSGVAIMDGLVGEGVVHCILDRVARAELRQLLLVFLKCQDCGDELVGVPA